MKEFYVKFKGRILVRAENWNEAEKEAKRQLDSNQLQMRILYMHGVPNVGIMFSMGELKLS